jgi:hypothetical protein
MDVQALRLEGGEAVGDRQEFVAHGGQLNVDPDRLSALVILANYAWTDGEEMERNAAGGFLERETWRSLRKHSS